MFRFFVGKPWLSIAFSKPRHRFHQNGTLPQPRAQPAVEGLLLSLAYHTKKRGLLLVANTRSLHGKKHRFLAVFFMFIQQKVLWHFWEVAETRLLEGVFLLGKIHF